MFRYEFMQVALLVGIMLAISLPLVGSSLVFKRLSMTGDALAHTSLAGVAIGLIAGVNPLITAMIVSVLSALTIEFMRKKFKKYAEISIAITLSAGVGLAGVLSSFTPMANFNTYLFGSIVAITPIEMWLSIIISVIVVVINVLLYKEIMYINYNEDIAKISKVPVGLVNFIFTLLTALTVAMASRTVGALVVSSLMVIPIASSMQLSRSYKSTLLLSILFANISVIFGLIFSYYYDVKPGGSIVLVSVVILIVSLIVNKIYTLPDISSKIKK